ncbi:hypothetical protein EYC59_04290 [Candidatus Saccharibacteria bacterium]|nr:MAG: hypothetical protein EYC59_04290 [Candidatus Saccharibacteria bacterium]
MRAPDQHGGRIVVATIQNRLHAVKKFFGNHRRMLTRHFHAVAFRNNYTRVKLVPEYAAHGLTTQPCFFMTFALFPYTLLVEYPRHVL